MTTALVLARATQAPQLLQMLLQMASRNARDGATDRAQALWHECLALMPTCVPAHYQLGAQCATTGNVLGAVQHWRVCEQHLASVETTADRVAILRSLAAALDQTGSAQAASAVCCRWWEIARDSEALLVAGRALLRAGAAADAERLFRLCVQEASSSAPAEAACGVVEALCEQGRFEEAGVELRTAQQAHPGHAMVVLSEAHWLHRQGSATRAATMYRRLLGDPGTSLVRQAAVCRVGAALVGRDCGAAALSLMRPALAQNPDCVDTLHVMGVAALLVGRTADAHDHLFRAAQLTPHCDSLVNALGVALEGLGRMNEAHGAYCTAMTRAPSCATYALNAASALASLSRYEEAVDAYRALLSTHRECIPAALGLCAALIGCGRFDDALSCVQSVVGGQVPASAAPHGWYLLARIHAATGNALELDLAVAACLKCDDAYSSALVRHGADLGRVGLVEPARQALLGALLLDPACAAAHCNLGALYLASNQLDSALGALQRCMQHDRSCVQGLFNWALLLMCNGQHEDALRCFQRSCALDDRHAPSHLLMSHCHEVLGNSPALRVAAVERALQLDATDADAHAVNGWLLLRQGDRRCHQHWEQCSALDPQHPLARWRIAGSDVLTLPPLMANLWHAKMRRPMFMV